LAPFQVIPQTSAILKARTKRREENEKASLETNFRQLLLEDGNNDPSPLLALSSSENPLALPVIPGPQGQQWHEPISLEVLRRFGDSIRENRANGPYTLALLENLS
jgi:hypothetical protein